MLLCMFYSTDSGAVCSGSSLNKCRDLHCLGDPLPLGGGGGILRYFETSQYVVVTGHV